MEVKQLETGYTYNSRLDLVKIEVKQKYIYKESIDLEAGVYLDFDENYLPVNLEILDATKRMDVDKEFLINPTGNVKILINDESINIHVTFENDNEKGFLDLNTFGDKYIPNTETDFALV